jgi:hypothetical protein
MNISVKRERRVVNLYRKTIGESIKLILKFTDGPVRHSFQEARGIGGNIVLLEYTSNLTDSKGVNRFVTSNETRVV